MNSGLFSPCACCKPAPGFTAMSASRRNFLAADAAATGLGLEPTSPVEAVNGVQNYKFTADETKAIESENAIRVVPSVRV